jgi:hypothetical protein
VADVAEVASLSRVIFRLSTRELSREVTLTPMIWRVLVQFDGTRTVAEISRGLGMEEATVAEVAETLFRSGALQVAPGSVAPPRLAVKGAFFDQISGELARAVGPLAMLTLEEEIAALGEVREAFPRERIPELVEHLSQTIRDDSKRLRFQQIMLESIRKL